jgi:hypothetical protein
MLLSEVVFLLFHHGVLDIDVPAAMDLGGSTDNYYPVLTAYMVMSTLSLISFVGYFECTRDTETWGGLRKSIARSRNIDMFINVSAIVTFFYLLVFVLFTDLSLVWYSEEYLTPTLSEDAISEFGSDFVSIVMSLSVLITIVVVIAAYVSYRRGRWYCTSYFASISILLFVLNFSKHSRAALLVPAVAALMHAVLDLKHKKTAIGALTALSLFTIIAALENRGLTEQGISSIPGTIAKVFTNDPEAPGIVDVILNVLQGIFVTAESLQIDTPFDERYKILSFSPLPSFLDGFSSINYGSQHRIHEYVPMAGIIEVYQFGVGYAALLAGLYVALIRVHLRLMTKSVLAFVVCNSMIYFSLYHLLSYPLRNGLHLFWIGSLVAVVGWVGAPGTQRHRAKAALGSKAEFAPGGDRARGT